MFAVFLTIIARMTFVNFQAKVTVQHLMETLCLKRLHPVTLVRNLVDSVVFVNILIMMAVQGDVIDKTIAV